MQLKLFSISFILVFSLAFAMIIWANVPAPPVNQQTGIPDGLFNDLEEEECRLCHENPDQFPVEPESIPDRHHLIMNSPVTVGTCSVSGTQCQPNAGLDCPESFEVCIGASAAPFPPTPGGIFTCFSCHDVDCSTGICNINLYRDCTFCHYQFIGGPGADTTVHHLTPTAQSGDCVFCHGDIVDNMDDGHIISTYAPSSVTPSPSGGDGLPLNSEGKGAGACDYCHSTTTGDPVLPDIDTATGILVHLTSRTHHFTGLGNDVVKCEWCHNMADPEEYRIRTCEGCHGYESLHNIQVDSDGDGVITPGVEMPFYGHIGDPDDCWGCHGFGPASAPGTGPITPNIKNSDISVVTAGHDTSVTLSGSAFTNLDDGVELLSNVVLTAYNGSTIELIPDSISQDSMTVIIPGNLATGNYYLRAVKGPSGSNPAVVSVKPEVTITDFECNGKRGILTISGSGFSEKVEGTDAYINAKLNGVKLDIISWTDTRIRASVSRCSSSDTVTVYTLFGLTTSGNGKPPKPCRGKGCNK
jgi:hypothetical protein